MARGMMEEGGAGGGLFDKMDEMEMREDVDAAVKSHRLLEIHEIDEFILTHSKMFRDIGDSTS